MLLHFLSWKQFATLALFLVQIACLRNHALSYVKMRNVATMELVTMVIRKFPPFIIVLSILIVPWTISHLHFIMTTSILLGYNSFCEERTPCSSVNLVSLACSRDISSKACKNACDTFTCCSTGGCHSIYDHQCKQALQLCPNLR